MMKRTFILSIVIMIIIGCYTLWNPTIAQYKGRTVHLSIDDVENCMRNLQDHSYDSIFDEPFFKYLYELHEDYGAKYTLYIYKEANGYDITQMPTKYKHQFSENSDWLRFAFHAIRPKFEERVTANIDTFSLAYRTVDSGIVAFAGQDSKSNIMRLHYFFATPEERNLISRLGGVILLSADDPDRSSYSLTTEQQETLHKGSYNDESLRFLATDLRIENMSIPDCDLRKHNENDTPVIFTHEWALVSRMNRLKLMRTLEILKTNNVKYLN